MIRLLRGLGTGVAVIGLLLGSTAPPAQAAYTRSCASHLHALPAVGPVAGTSVQAYFFYQDYWLRGDYCQIGKAKITCSTTGTWSSTTRSAGPAGRRAGAGPG